MDIEAFDAAAKARRVKYIAAHPLFNGSSEQKLTSPASREDTIADYRMQIECIDMAIMDLLEAKGRAEANLQALETETEAA